MSNLLRPPTAVRDEIPAQRLPAPPREPQLLWPSIIHGQRIENQDISSFPTQDYIFERDKAGQNGMVLKLVAFEDAVIEAEVHILVLDPHFDQIGANVLEPALSISHAVDVRLLTSGSGFDSEERERLRKRLTRRLNMNRVDARQVEVRWNTSLDKRYFPFLHDRFAIIDGALWHFGSTVGGGHSSLTAASGPWAATGTRAKEFFEECWRSPHA